MMFRYFCCLWSRISKLQKIKDVFMKEDSTVCDGNFSTAAADDVITIDDEDEDTVENVVVRVRCLKTGITRCSLKKVRVVLRYFSFRHMFMSLFK